MKNKPSAVAFARTENIGNLVNRWPLPWVLAKAWEAGVKDAHDALSKATIPNVTAVVEDAGLERLTEALTPSSSTKCAYHGEFYFDIDEGVSDAGIDQHRKIYVPWDVVKRIMAAIRHRAALAPTVDGAVS